jgi:hypothetical protein
MFKAANLQINKTNIKPTFFTTDGERIKQFLKVDLAGCNISDVF